MERSTTRFARVWARPGCISACPYKRSIAVENRAGTMVMMPANEKPLHSPTTFVFTTAKFACSSFTVVALRNSPLADPLGRSGAASGTSAAQPLKSNAATAMQIHFIIKPDSAKS